MPAILFFEGGCPTSTHTSNQTPHNRKIVWPTLDYSAKKVQNNKLGASPLEPVRPRLEETYHGEDGRLVTRYRYLNKLRVKHMLVRLRSKAELETLLT